MLEVLRKGAPNVNVRQGTALDAMREEYAVPNNIRPSRAIELATGGAWFFDARDKYVGFGTGAGGPFFPSD